MSHFSQETWADFVRGIDPGGSRGRVEEHLASDCKQCGTDHALWSTVVRLALKESEYVVPQEILEAAEEIFFVDDAAHLEDWPLASMLFDSAFTPMAAGVRSGASSCRQLVYEGEGLMVDMRFERRPQSNKVSATGQVLDKDIPLRWLGKAAIVLWNDKGQLLTKTEAGEYGEFQFEFVPEERMRISIATADRRTLRIALGDLY